MVSQSQDGVGWDGSGSPSRTGSLLSLDSRQRPAPAKTPPSYYDAVRSRHSLSQPRPSDGSKQEKGHPGQQVKYNSLPRPLPQRYPPTSANGQQHRPWPDDHYDPVRPNSNQAWRPGDHPAPRQLLESPPKPANHVPLQLQVHNQERYLVKRGPEQTESCNAPGLAGPRGNDPTRINGGPRADRLTVDCNARGNSMDMVRKDSLRNLSHCPDARSPPNILPGGRPAVPRMVPTQGEHSTNSLPRRDSNQSSGLLRRCYTMTPDGYPINASNYPSRSSMNGVCNYEPRYSKSGKFCPRPLSQGFESRPMPPPAVQLRTGPLGSYPDPETLKRSEMSAYNRSFEEFDRQGHRTPSHGDISQQIYVDTNSYANGQTVITDHLAIPYRIPQVSPKNTRSFFDSCSGKDSRTQPSPSVSSRAQPSPSTNGIKGIKPQQLSTCPRSMEDHCNPNADHRNRRHHEGNTTQYSDNLQTYSNQSASVHGFNKHPSSPDNRNSSHLNDNGVIYANHQMSFPSSGLNDHNSDHRSVQKRSPPMTNGNSSVYEKQPQKNCSRELQELSQDNATALYANQHVSSTRYKSNPLNNQHDDMHPPSSFQIDCDNTVSNSRNPYNSQKSHLPPPPVAQKPRPTLPQPSEMIMVTETRGWNGQANSYPKDVVKPTPRMPRFANIASGTQLSTVPAYQCVINELSSQNGQQTFSRSSDSSTLSLRSGYDSSSSSVRDYGRQPSKSDSSLDMRKLSEGGLKSASSQQRIDKSFLSASMTSLCSDASSSVSTRRHRIHPEDPNWDRMNEEFHKRKDKGSVFSASPWEREEKEKLQREQVLDARRARDQEIAFLESVQERSEKQEEWLRILRLEREFQRRAEQEMREDEDDDEDDEDDIEKQPVAVEVDDKVESFHGDKGNTIPNERNGLKLLDELLENSSKSPSRECIENREFAKSPSEKHFIPLELTIPDRDLPQPSSLPPGSSILQVLDQKSIEHSSARLTKPPIPAPRPSKTSSSFRSDIGISDHHSHHMPESESDVNNQNGSDMKTMDLSMRSLAKLDISDSSPYNDCNNIGRDYLQDNWLIEVNSYENGSVPDNSKPASKQNGDQKEESRIYENIMEFHGLKRHNSASQNGSHTLPKSTNSLMAKDLSNTRSFHMEKKFPAMGLTSTLSRKLNGHVPCDSDILPALYASSKVKNGYQKDIPSDLEDKSPEFKKMWISRPEKLTFQDKIRKFSLQAGEEDIPRDRVKNSRAQREIEIKFSEGQRKAMAATET